MFVEPTIVEEVLRFPAGLGRVSFVSRADVAAAIVNVVVAQIPEKLFYITGPAALDFHDAAKYVSEVTGNPLRYEAITEQTYHTMLVQQGVDPWRVAVFTTLFGSSVAGGSFERVSSDVKWLTNIQQGTFRDCITARELTKKTMKD
jgi:NAD(P)H dehydrogenase (quinone)